MGIVFYSSVQEVHLVLVIPSTIIIIFLFRSIYKTIDRTNQDLTRFLQSIKYSDFSQTFSSKQLGKSFDELYASFNEVMDKFRKTRGEKEEQNRYLQTVLRHVGVGLIAFQTDGKIEFVNQAARRLLGIKDISHLNILNQFDDKLSLKLLSMKSGDRETIKIYDETDVLQLIVYATEFKMRDSLIKLVSVQNIQSELEEKEFESWQKLIRVLTHEIMNSITPISSLSSTVNNMLANGDPNDLKTEDVEDIKNALTAIHRRSDGLIKFVENYRSLTKIPKPDFQIISIQSLFERLNEFLSNDLKENKVTLTSEVNPSSLELTADQVMIEQVLINMIINSIQALQGKSDKTITLSSNMNDKGRVVIKIHDNGTGIPPEVQEKIFIPFFSTKSSGSGIGLSLARQILRAHGGNIRVQSKPNEGTTFSLFF